MTNPMKIKSRVTVNSQLSTLTRFAMERTSFHHGHTESSRFFAADFREDLTLLVRLPGQRSYDFLEYFSAVFVVAELVETGTGRSEQHDIARLGSLGRVLDSGFQSFGVIDFGASAFRGDNLRFDLGGGGPDGVNALHALPEQIVQDGVVAAFVLATENEVDVGGERFDCLDGGVDIRCLGIVVIFHSANRTCVFQPVLDRFEVMNRFADAVGLA